MSRNLVVVESPAKAKTIKKYLGKDFEVLASFGHVRDLVPKEGAVDTQHNFAMRYDLVEKNTKHVQAITRAMKKADALYLATDPDREGEAISWHLYELLKEKRVLKEKAVHRVVFHEVTKRAVQEAVAHPRELCIAMINAQQARRALDYLVGFTLSPLLWKKIRRGLSAGRVQSPALRMIAEREIEIESFQKREYWTIEADCNKQGKTFKAKLTYYRGKKLSQFTLTNETQAKDIEQQLSQEAKSLLRVQHVEKKQRRRNPAPPFITSTLQQEAARKLGFSTQQTMRIAQQLYEGIDIGSEEIGLITYMRTDSVNLSNEALGEIRVFIEEQYGTSLLPKQARRFKTKSKNAQEAHEAVRPTYASHIPEAIQDKLSPDQYRLYNLIWKRTVACQMIHATINTVAVDLSAHVPVDVDITPQDNFRVTGSVIANAGFMTVYREGVDDEKIGDDQEKILPLMEPGQSIDLQAILPTQHFTDPPPRYSEASLVKALEEHGIGRPSTYASIVSTLLQREYVYLEKRRFFVTDVGRIVSKFLTQHFSKYVDYDFTANLEDELDAVARSEMEWIPLMRSFWTPFQEQVKDKEESVKRSDVTHEILDEACPKCNSPLSKRLGRHGFFIGCTAYPNCDYTRDPKEDQNDSSQQQIEGRTCPKCSEPLLLRRGRYGKFIGCSAYPKCKFIEPLEKPEDTNVSCPKCHVNTLFKRKSRNDKIFYSCGSYPTCNYAIWHPPLTQPCPKCGWPILTIKTTKRYGQEKVCPQKKCSFHESYSDETELDKTKEMVTDEKTKPRKSKKKKAPASTES